MTTSSSRFFTSNFDPIPRSDLKFKRKFYIPSKTRKIEEEEPAVESSRRYKR
jgi:hypothetical protein